MRTTVYICDSCSKDLGDSPHLSIDLNRHSGWVRSSGSGIWSHDQTIDGRPYHFCNTKCLGKFFDSLKEEKKK